MEAPRNSESSSALDVTTSVTYVEHDHDAPRNSPLVGLFAAALWIVSSFDLVKISVEADFLCPHLDQDRGLSFVRERFIKLVDMSIEDYAIASIAAPPLLVEPAGVAVILGRVPTIPGGEKSKKE